LIEKEETKSPGEKKSGEQEKGKRESGGGTRLGRGERGMKVFQWKQRAPKKRGFAKNKMGGEKSAWHLDREGKSLEGGNIGGTFAGLRGKKGDARRWGGVMFASGLGICSRKRLGEAV